MRTFRKCFLVFTLLLILLSCPGSKKAVQVQQVFEQDKKDKQSVTDPCSDVWLEKPYSGERLRRHKVRMERETYGYPKDIPMSEALRIFNEEAKCSTTGRDQAPLTENELIAASIDRVDYGRENVRAFQQPGLQKIAEQKVMPKGSLLIAESGGCKESFTGSKQVCVKGWKIYLLLGLDSNPRESNALNPAQIFLIRKSYFGFETKDYQ